MKTIVFYAMLSIFSYKGDSKIGVKVDGFGYPEAYASEEAAKADCEKAAAEIISAPRPDLDHLSLECIRIERDVPKSAGQEADKEATAKSI